MTTIAWDGTTLAVDRQWTSDGLKETGSKLLVEHVGGRRVAMTYTGTLRHCLHLVRWYREGADPDKWPKEAGDAATLVVLAADGKPAEYAGAYGYPLQAEDGVQAWGSGAKYALGAMYCGKSAKLAVEVAAHFDTHTGRGVETVRAVDLV